MRAPEDGGRLDKRRDVKRDGHKAQLSARVQKRVRRFRSQLGRCGASGRGSQHLRLGYFENRLNCMASIITDDL
jgi:hypothetical protein